MKDLVYIVLTLAAAAVAAWRMWIYVQPKSQGGEQMMDLVLFIVAVLLGITFGGLFLAGRVNKEEEIHITK